MSTKKRPRQSDAAVDANAAECPFTAAIVNSKDRDHKKKKRKRSGDAAEEEEKIPFQPSVFSPTGKFKTYDTLDVHWRVDPARRWNEMTRYNSFVRK